MITDDLRIQDEILIYLYKYVNEVVNICELETNIEDAVREDIERQLYILFLKNLVTFSETLSFPGKFTETMHMKITGNGCECAEKVLLERHISEENAQDWLLS